MLNWLLKASGSGTPSNTVTTKTNVSTDTSSLLLGIFIGIIITLVFFAIVYMIKTIYLEKEQTKQISNEEASVNNDSKECD